MIATLESMTSAVHDAALGKVHQMDPMGWVVSGMPPFEPADFAAQAEMVAGLADTSPGSELGRVLAHAPGYTFTDLLAVAMADTATREAAAHLFDANAEDFIKEVQQVANAGAAGDEEAAARAGVGLLTSGSALLAAIAIGVKGLDFTDVEGVLEAGADAVEETLKAAMAWQDGQCSLEVFTKGLTLTLMGLITLVGAAYTAGGLREFTKREAERQGHTKESLRSDLLG